MDNGYGQVTIDAITQLAHRVSYALLVGSCEGKFLLHRCDNPRCVNPTHLVPGTAQDNSDDCVAKGRQAKGSMFSHAKLTEADVKQIRINLSRGETGKQQAIKYGVAESLISKIRNYQNWKHV